MNCRIFKKKILIINKIKVKFKKKVRNKLKKVNEMIYNFKNKVYSITKLWIMKNKINNKQ